MKIQNDTIQAYNFYLYSFILTLFNAEFYEYFT